MVKQRSLYWKCSAEQLTQLCCLEWGLGYLFWAVVLFFYSGALFALSHALWVACLGLIASCIAGLYKGEMNLDRPEEILRAILAFCVRVILISALFYCMGFMLIPGGRLILMVLCLSLLNAGVRSVYWMHAGMFPQKKRLVILGAGNTAMQLKEEIDRLKAEEIEVLGYIHKPGDRQRIYAEATLHLPPCLAAFCKAERVDTIVVAVDDRRSGFPLMQLLACKQAGVRILDGLSFYEDILGKVQISILESSAFVFSDHFKQTFLQTKLKRLSDLLLSLLLIVILAPLLSIIVILTWVSHFFSGPAFEKQHYVGLEGQLFCVSKMKESSLSSGLNYCLNHLGVAWWPCLWNILIGEMSFVGPEPLTVIQMQTLGEKNKCYVQRQVVRPGVFHWGSYLDFSFDLFYIKNNSILLDFSILLNVFYQQWAPMLHVPLTSIKQGMRHAMQKIGYITDI